MTRPVSIALLSHRSGNIGHNFMAIGVEEIVRQTFVPAARIGHYEQHHHFSIYPEGHWLRLLHRVPHGRLRWLRRLLNDPTRSQRLWKSAADLRSFDFAVACGGPNIVREVARSAEMALMFHHLYGGFTAQGVPVLDLGVGACFPLERIPRNAEDAFSSDDRGCYERLFQSTHVTTVRDQVALRLLADMGRAASIIPCAALCSGYAFERYAAEGGPVERDHILINYQRHGANSDWGQGVDPERWRATVASIVNHFSSRHRIAFVCHNTWERDLAQKHFPNFPAHLPANEQEYARVISRARTALVSRIHCAIPLAGLGIPSLAAGTDTRIGTVATMGLPTVFAKTAQAAECIATLEKLLREGEAERARLLALRAETCAQYGRLMRSLVEMRGAASRTTVGSGA